VTGWAGVLRALVFAAIDAKGTPGYAGAQKAIYEGWCAWPLVEANERIAEAQAELERNRIRREQALELLRESSHLVNHDTEKGAG